MLPLDASNWAKLSDAYSNASDIPLLLNQLESLPTDVGYDSEPYFSLWSALCHQGDVYTASYAAVPHIIRIMSNAPERVPMTLFVMVASIEIARFNGRGPKIPSEIEADYFAALSKIPELVSKVASLNWDHLYCGAVLAASAASKGHVKLAEAILELDPETVDDVLRRRFGE